MSDASRRMAADSNWPATARGLPCVRLRRPYDAGRAGPRPHEMQQQLRVCAAARNAGRRRWSQQCGFTRPAVRRF